SRAKRRANGDENTRLCPLPRAGVTPPLPLRAVGCGCVADVPPLKGGGAGADAGADTGLAELVGGVPFPAPAAADFTSSPSAAITAISWFTGTSAAPSGTRILASVPSSTASYSIVALSVSISAITSPGLTLSPSFLSHLARLPFSMVGDNAGIRMLIG